MSIKFRVWKNDFSASVVDPSGSSLPHSLLTEIKLVACNLSYELTEHIREHMYLSTILKTYSKEEPLKLEQVIVLYQGPF